MGRRTKGVGKAPANDVVDGLMSMVDHITRLAIGFTVATAAVVIGRFYLEGSLW